MHVQGIYVNVINIFRIESSYMCVCIYTYSLYYLFILSEILWRNKVADRLTKCSLQIQSGEITYYKTYAINKHTNSLTIIHGKFIPSTP